MASILCIDGMYLLHRARSGFKLGPAPVIFNFMRTFRALVEKFAPAKIYFVLEGHPQQRIDNLPSYKGNREVEPDSKEAVELDVFYSQVNVIVAYLKSHFPVSVVRHPDYECDDTIANLVRRSSAEVEWTIVSGDSDFTQLLNSHSNVKIFNPVKKEFVQAPHYDYVTWKALRGDATDNIPGIPGIGDIKAEKMMDEPDMLQEVLDRKDWREIFERNYQLIKFYEWDDVDAFKMTTSAPTRNWDVVKQLFERHGFKSIVEPSAWEKFTATFDHLFDDK